MQTDQKLSVIHFDTAKLRMGNLLNILERVILSALSKKRFVSINKCLRNFKDIMYQYILKINLSYVDITLKQELVLISRRKGEHL